MTGRLRRVVVAMAVLLTAAALPVSSAPDDPTVRFSAAGDFSSSVAAQSVFRTIGGLDNDLHVALGDLSYGAVGAEQRWCDLVKAGVGEGYPFELLSGNHESNGLNGNINDFSACLPNQLPGVKGTYGRQYSVDVPRAAPLVRFINLSAGLTYPDSTWDYTTGSTRYQWVASAIDEARAAQIPWVVVSVHKPCLSLGQYGCDSGVDLANLLVAKKVDLVLSGHEHLYQRTKQLGIRSGCTAIQPGTFTSACVVDGDDSLLKGAGTIFATVGTGGVGLRDVNGGDSEAGYFAASSGLNSDPTWGVLAMSATATKLDASFVRAAGGTFSDAFTIAAGPAPVNQDPVALFSSSCTQLVCSVDATTSGDPDGSITSYAWQWGDGTSGSGATTTHTYADAGTFPVTLTVTDDGGARASATRSVTVQGPTSPSLVRDDFGRTAATGWGAADTGGTWSLTSALSNFTVGGGAGHVKVAAGGGPYMLLPSTAVDAVDLGVDFALDKQTSGSGLYLSLIGRRISTAGDYRAKVRIQSSGAVALGLQRTAANGAEVALASLSTLPGVVLAPGDHLQVRLQVTGSSPTTLRARAWKAGTAEPLPWQATSADSTSGMQAAGHTGLAAYLSGAATNAPITVTVDELRGTALP